MPLNMRPPILYRKTAKEKDGFFDCQTFADHKGMAERLKKTLYYGKLPKTDRPSMPMTELAVEFFSEAVPEGLGQLDMHYAASITRNACISPCSMILAMAYIERLKGKSPEYLRQISSSDLFLVSMMVASKFLYDEGEIEEVLNDEWAKSANMETKEVNVLERKFLKAIDWNIFLKSSVFEDIIKVMELKIARRKIKDRGWCTYTDINTLTSSLQALKYWELLKDSFVKVIVVSAVAYSMSFLAVVCSVVVVRETQTRAVHLAKSIGECGMFSTSNDDTRVPVDSVKQHIENSTVFQSDDVILPACDCLLASRLSQSEDQSLNSSGTVFLLSNFRTWNNIWWPPPVHDLIDYNSKTLAGYNCCQPQETHKAQYANQNKWTTHNHISSERNDTAIALFQLPSHGSSSQACAPMNSTSDTICIHTGLAFRWSLFI